MTRIIFYRNSYAGGDGWTYYTMPVQLSDNCPKCGQPRGEAHPGRVIEDGEVFCVDTWVNPCGHQGLYRDCWQEHNELINPTNRTK